MMVYKYSLHDPDSGKVLYEGTAADLAAQGVVRAEKILPTLWRDQQRQHKRRGKHRWDITREKVEVACSRKAYKVRLKPKKTAAVQAKPPKRPAKPKAAALPVPKPVAPRAPRVRLKKYLTDPTPLQRDVRELEGYNAKARERGKKELSYGYWAAEGKPVCTPDCPDRHPACSDRCEKYRAWKAEVQKEKTYTKSQNDAGKINRNDFDAEFWMGGKHK